MASPVPETDNPPSEVLAGQLQAWARAHIHARASVSVPVPLGGHSQITAGFSLQIPGRPDEALVLKLPPVGVAARNNFDVLRQVPLLQLLARHGIPAPQARYWSGQTEWFGAPFLIMSRLAGASPGDVFGASAGAGLVDAAAQFREAVHTLARIHAIPATDLPLTGPTRDASQEIDHWVQVVGKSSDAGWIALAMQVRERLHVRCPGRLPEGLVHGDYYSNNWVFDGARLSGVVDWEGSTRGPLLLDLGWLAAMYEPASWGALRRDRMDWHPAAEQMIAWYAEVSPLDLSALDWYRALAAYRLACITAYYFERHRTGKRRNPAWEVLGDAYPHLMGGALRRLTA